MHSLIQEKWDTLKTTPLTEIVLVTPKKGELNYVIKMGTHEFIYSSRANAKEDIAEIRAKIMVTLEKINWVGTADIVHEVTPIEYLADTREIRAQNVDGEVFQDRSTAFFTEGVKPVIAHQGDDLHVCVNLITELSRDKVLEMVDSVRQGESLERQIFYQIGVLNILTKGFFEYDKINYQSVDEWRDHLLRII